MKNKENFLAASERLLIVIVVLFLLYQFSLSTTWFLPFPGWTRRAFLIALAAVAAFRALLLWPWKREYMAALFMAAIYALAYRAYHYDDLIFCGVLTVCFAGMRARKILKLFCMIFAFSLAVTFIGALGGGIQNYVFMKDGFIRSSLGICYPTDLATSVLFLLMFSWAAWKEFRHEAALILGLFSVWFSKYVAMSVTSTICSGVFAAVVLSVLLWERMNLSGKLPGGIKRGVRIVMILSFPALGCLMFMLITAYGKEFGFAQYANTILSSRLQHPLNAYHEFGLHAFGAPLTQIGGGFSTFSRPDYNFVDSTYPLILLRYGWVLFLAVCVVWPYMLRKALRAGDLRLAAVMVLIAIHSFSEHHFIEPWYNILVVLPFAVPDPMGNGIGSDEKGKKKENEIRNINKHDRLRKFFPALYGMIVLLLLLFAAPVCLSWMRTVVEILGWYGGGRNGVKVWIFVAGALGLLGVLVVSVYLLVTRFLFSDSRSDSDLTEGHGRTGQNEELQPSRVIFLPALLAAASLLLLCAGAWKCDRLVEHVTFRYEEQMEADRPALTAILEAEEGKVYINSVPEIYRRHFPGLDASLWLGDDQARLYNVTAVMDRDYDSKCFINSGFLYTPISERHSVYTNDVSVMEALKEKGYHLTGYYNEEKTVDLPWMAERNGLQLAEDGILLSGPEHSMIYGPYLSLYSGRYLVTYRLSISGEERERIGTAGTLGRLRVSAYYGNKIIREQTISGKLFDEQGTAVVEIPFSTDSSEGIEFLAFLEDGHSMTIEEIAYCRSPQYDVHALYNRKRLKYRDEYYTLEGEPAETAQGYSACEYGYNYDRYVNEIRYYGADGAPVVISQGYASLKRDLDAKNRVIREAYFDVDGSPKLCRSHYAVNEREYDSDGNAVVQRYFGTDGAPIITTAHCAEVRRTFNDRHQVIREEYYGTDGEKLTRPEGYAATEMDLDTSGRAVAQRYFDADDQPVITTMGYAGILREFDSKNRVAREQYMGTDGVLMALPQGHSALEREFDDRGNAVVLRYLDEQDRPVMTTGGYAEIHREYNSRNYVIYESYFDEKGEPVLLPQKYAAASYVRDEVGNGVVICYYGLDGARCVRKEGYSEIHRTFNDKRQVVKDVYFDQDGGIATLPSGYSMTDYERDEAGHAVVQRYYDEEGRPVLASWGYFETRRTYGADGKLAGQTFYDMEGKEVKKPE